MWMSNRKKNSYFIILPVLGKDSYVPKPEKQTASPERQFANSEKPSSVSTIQPAMLTLNSTHPLLSCFRPVATALERGLKADTSR
jgi:hypothetical protein